MYLYLFVALPFYQLTLLLQYTYLNLSKMLPFLCAYTHTHTHIYIYIYIYLLIQPFIINILSYYRIIYGYAFLLPLCYMSEYVEVIRVQPHFIVQLCLDATRLIVWDACPNLFFVNSDLLLQELTNSTYNSLALVMLNRWVYIDSEPRAVSRIH